jgi:oligopeptide/dipeptide ABC transporter ATP-binding protein
LSQPLLEVRGLSKVFTRGGGLAGPRRVVRALDSVDLTIMPGQTVGLVGESGCGKSTLGRCVLRLIEPTSGQVRYRGVELLSLSRAALRPYRGEMQMLYQNPYASLNPRLNVLSLVAEPLQTHTDLAGQGLRARVQELLALVGLEGEMLRRYPHEFSGGQLQRIALARALALNPKLLILDEPTSALDVSVQAKILNLLLELQQRLGLTYLFISHDLGVVQHISDQIVVMYLGRVVEAGPTEAIFGGQRHPYTEALLSSTPAVSLDHRRQRIILDGGVPDPANPPPGCKFAPRCPARVAHALAICDQQEPALKPFQPSHAVRCWLYDEAGPFGSAGPLPVGQGEMA